MKQLVEPSKQPAKNRARLSPQKLLAYAGACCGALFFAGAVLLFLFGGVILDGYGRSKAERAFAKAYPGSLLRIAELHYSIRGNCLIAESVLLSATNTALKVDRVSLTGVRWSRLLWGTAPLAEVLAKASLDATNLDLQLPQARYGIRCARLHASVPDSELIADETELRPLVGDEEFFAAHEFRTTRFHVVAPQCRVLGLAYDELLNGKSYQARSIQFSRPSLDALVNRDKPERPFVKSPLMVNEALAAIRQPLQVDSLIITNGRLRYCERLLAGADPGVLTISEVNLSAEGIANRGGESSAIQLHARGELMEAGILNVLMSIPIMSPEFSFHYSGSLSTMDLTRLDAFLDIAEHLRIKSGSAQEASFDIDVVAGQARGRVRGIYQNLEIALLDQQSGTAKRLDHRIASFLMNELKIRTSNAPNASGSMKEGVVNYVRGPGDEFQQFAWFALRTGVLDLISH